MASGAEQGLAKKLLSLRGRGSAVSNDLAAAARRVLDGQGRSGDMDAIRAYFNVGRSGASSLRRMTGTGSRLIGVGMNVSRDIDLMVSGSAAAGPRAAANVALGVADEIVKNRRALTKVGESVCERIGADPAIASRMFNSLSRVAKVGGVAGSIVLAAFSVANSAVETMQTASRNMREAQKQGLEYGNRLKESWIQEKAASQVESERILGYAASGLAGIMSDYNPLAMFNEWLASRNTDEVAKRQMTMLARAKTNREMVRGHGGVALAEFAAARGKAIGDLTEMERNQALDRLAEGEIRYTVPEFLQYAQTKLDELSPMERMHFKGSDAIRNGYINKWKDELNARATERYGTRLEAKALAEEEAMLVLSPTDRLKLSQARAEGTASFSSYRSRHQTVILD